MNLVRSVPQNGEPQITHSFIKRVHISNACSTDRYTVTPVNQALENKDACVIHELSLWSQMVL